MATFSMLMEESPAVSKHAIVVFGVCGCGKSTVGKLLAVQLQSPFLEGDEFHPSENIQKMTANSPLSDEDRAPWLARLGQELGASARKNGNAVAACSALKKKYRDQLIEAAQMPITFVYLKGSQELIAGRMAKRPDHFMPTKLLESQFASLETPTPDEQAIILSIDKNPEEIVKAAFTKLRKNRRE